MSPASLQVLSRAGQVRMVNLKDSTVLDIVRYILSLGRVPTNYLKIFIPILLEKRERESASMREFLFDFDQVL